MATKTKSRKRAYVSRLTKEEQMVRLILRIMTRDEKRRQRELTLTDDILLIGMATRIQLGLLGDIEDDSEDEDIFSELVSKPRGGKQS